VGFYFLIGQAAGFVHRDCHVLREGVVVGGICWGECYRIRAALGYRWFC